MQRFGQKTGMLQSGVFWGNASATLARWHRCKSTAEGWHEEQQRNAAANLALARNREAIDLGMSKRAR